jgi:hypothetical protein
VTRGATRATAAAGATSTATMGRHEVATRLGIHQDTVTARLRDGLAAAVLEWGGHGKLMTFSRVYVERFGTAWNCRREGRRCTACCLALEDLAAVGEHLLEARHGVGGCELCTAPAGVLRPLHGSGDDNSRAAGRAASQGDRL